MTSSVGGGPAATAAVQHPSSLQHRDFGTELAGTILRKKILNMRKIEI